MTSSTLSLEGRDQALRLMESEPEFDVLVIGGGVVGAGCALDAAARGLRTALVEAGDWAGGTSSRSSKLIHGGLRYLEMLDFRLVREALRERGLLVNHLAPHLVHPVAFLYPLNHRVWERLYTGSGIALYDLMATSRRSGVPLPHHRHLTRTGALRIVPALRPDALVGAIQYYDAQVDDARLVVTLARTAAAQGALVASGTRVIGFERTGPRVTAARVRDVETGREFRIRARVIISATGVWSDETQALAAASAPVRVRASKGVHVIVRRDRLDIDSGLILRTEKSVLFVIPWGAFWLIGTTDTDFNEDKDHPTATDDDVNYLLDHLNALLTTPVRREDVEGVYAGLRPLISGESESTAKLSREHSVSQPVPGLVVVAGGKYTTYRVMAEDTIDEAAKSLGGRVPPSCTSEVPLLGAAGWPAVWNRRAELAADAGLDVPVVEHLLHRYGTLTPDVLALIAADPTLGGPIDPTAPYLRAEIVYAVTYEGALHLADVLIRRTHLSIETPDHGVAAAHAAVSIMAPLLGWDEQRSRDELERYLEVVRLEWAQITTA